MDSSRSKPNSPSNRFGVIGPPQNQSPQSSYSLFSGSSPFGPALVTLSASRPATSGVSAMSTPVHTPLVSSSTVLSPMPPSPASSSPLMVPVLAPTGRYHYTREFQTVAQQQYNTNNGFGGSHPFRARSYSFGIYDPVTDTRTNRAHQHVDNFRSDSGMPIPKPDAAGASGGTGHISSSKEMGWLMVPVFPPPRKPGNGGSGDGGSGGTGGGVTA